MAENEKQYSYIGAKKVGESVFVSLVDFVNTEIQIGQTNGGEKVASFSMALKNTNKRLTGLFGDAAAPETLWVQVSGYNSGKVTLADRMEKAIRKGQRVAVTGFVTKKLDSKGETHYNMSLRDFAIVYYPASDGREKRNAIPSTYSFVNGVKVSDNRATLAFIGYVASEARVYTDQNGKEAISVSVALNQTGSKVTYPLGIEGSAPETLWLSVSINDSDKYQQVSRAKDILKKGTPFFGIGDVIAKQGDDGRTFYNLFLDNFNVLPRATKTEQQPVGAGVGASEAMTASSEIEDDDLPF